VVGVEVTQIKGRYTGFMLGTTDRYELHVNKFRYKERSDLTWADAGLSRAIRAIAYAGATGIRLNRSCELYRYNL
jgi:hypothetical protein